jgi:hypothetical protein
MLRKIHDINVNVKPILHFHTLHLEGIYLRGEEESRRLGNCRPAIMRIRATLCSKNVSRGGQTLVAGHVI